MIPPVQPHLSPLTGRERQSLIHRPGQSIRLARGHQESTLARLHQLRHAANPRGHYRRRGSQLPLHHDVGHALPRRGEHEPIGGRQERRDIRPHPQEQDPGGDSRLFPRLLLQRLQQRPPPRNRQTATALRGLKCLQEGRVVF